MRRKKDREAKRKRLLKKRNEQILEQEQHLIKKRGQAFFNVLVKEKLGVCICCHRLLYRRNILPFKQESYCKCPQNFLHPAVGHPVPR